MKGPKDYLQDDWAEGSSPEETCIDGEECPMCGEIYPVLNEDLCPDCTIEYNNYLDDLMLNEDEGEYE